MHSFRRLVEWSQFSIEIVFLYFYSMQHADFRVHCYLGLDEIDSIVLNPDEIERSPFTDCIELHKTYSLQQVKSEKNEIRPFQAVRYLGRDATQIIHFLYNMSNVIMGNVAQFGDYLLTIRKLSKKWVGGGCKKCPHQ